MGKKEVVILIAFAAFVAWVVFLVGSAEGADKIIKKQGNGYKVYDNKGLQLKSQYKWNPLTERYDHYDFLGLQKKGELRENKVMDRWEYKSGPR